MRTVICLLLVTTATHAAPLPKLKPDSLEAKLQGEWVAVEVTEKDRPLEPAALNHSPTLYKFARSTIEMSNDGRKPESFSFSLRPRADKKDVYEFDFRRADDEPNHSLIRLDDDDTFSLVVHSRFRPNRPEDRPTAFTSKNNKQLDPRSLWNPVVLKFKRVRIGQKPADVIDAHYAPAEKK